MLTHIPTSLRSASLPTTEPPPATTDPPRTSTTISIQTPPDEPCLPRTVFPSTLLSPTVFCLLLLNGPAARARALASPTLLPFLQTRAVTLITLILPISTLCIRASSATLTRLTNYWRPSSRPRVVVGLSRAWRAPARLSQSPYSIFSGATSTLSTRCLGFSRAPSSNGPAALVMVWYDA